MSSIITRKRFYFNNLDGLRGLFFVLVFISHGCEFDSPKLQQHWLKPVVHFGTVHNPSLVLAFFFVMSSFIITMLLLRERWQTGQVHVGAFYLRRVLRILPLYYVVLLVAFGLYPWLRSFGSHPYQEPAQLSHFLLFVQNLYFMENIPKFFGLNVLWSLAVEEQFYLVWPLLLALLPLRWLAPTFLGILAWSVGWQAAHPLELFHTLTCTSDLAIGGLAALLVFYAHEQRLPLARRCLLAIRRQSWLVILVVWVLAVYLYRRGLTAAPPAWQPFERLVVDLVAVVVMLEQNYARHSLFKLGQWPAFRRLGQLAYGLYLLHAIAITIVQELYLRLGLSNTVWDAVLTRPVLAFGLSFGMAVVSFKYLELPFLRLYGRLMPRPEPAPPAEPAALDVKPVGVG
jgi:peptidoglycan/LPS O-acetylase OafA/YrhL